MKVRDIDSPCQNVWDKVPFSGSISLSGNRLLYNRLLKTKQTALEHSESQNEQKIMEAKSQ